MHKSSSIEQQMAAAEIFRQLATEQNWNVGNFQTNGYIPLQENGSVFICPDFYSERDGIIGEIHAHIGKLKPAQKHKICADIMKMLLFEKARNIQLRKMIVVCSEEEASQLEGSSYLGEAIRQFDIEMVYIKIDPSLHDKLVDAQKRQMMINA